MDVDRISEGDMDFNIQIYAGELWTDDRLNLSTFTQDGISEVIFPAYLTKHIWVPDIIFENVKKASMFQLSVPNTVIKIRKNGMFRRSTRYSLLIGCHMEFQYYPMDTQHCYLKMCSLGNADHKVLLHWTEELDSDVTGVELVNAIQPLEFVLHKPKSHKSTSAWTSGNYTYLYANFTFERRLSGTVFNVYIPSVLVVCLSWISFWLDVTAVPARVTLGVTSLLTLATQIVQAKAGLPTISYLTAVDVWLLVCLISVFSSLLEFAVAYQISILSAKPAEKEPYHKVNVVMRRDKVLSSRQKDDVSERKNITPFDSPSAKGERIRLDVDKVCRKLFPLTFGTFSAVYWSYYLYNR